MSRLGARLARDDRGSGTVLVLALVGAVAVLTVSLAWLVGAVVAQGSAQSAADLSALAAAAGVQRGAADPCDLAGQVVSPRSARR